MNFKLTSEQELIKKTAADFAIDELLDGEIETYRDDLFAYCKLDTLAMVRILDHLKQV